MPRRGDGASEVIPGIWRVREREASSYVVKLSPGAVLIDTGPDTSARAIMMGLQTARVGLSSVRAILLTSVEAEALGGLRALAARARAPAFGPPYRDGASSPPDADLFHPLRPGDVVADYFRAVALPGAEPSMAYFFPPARALFCGSLCEPAHDLPADLDVDRIFGRRDSNAEL